MSYQFYLNQSNLNTSNATNSVYTLNFQGSIDLTGKEIAITNVTIPYSWYNISSTIGNNSFQYVWTDGTVVTVTIPNGGYNVSDINAYLEYVMVQNLHYLIDSSGNNVYYLNISTNTTAYAVTLTSLQTPSSLPAGWSYPATASWTVNNYNPQFYLNNSVFNAFIGFASASTYYPATLGVQSGNLSYNSTLTPNISTIQTVLMATTAVNNTYSRLPQLVYSFTPNVSFGNIINITPYQLLYTECTSGQQFQLSISFLDQNYAYLRINDSNIQISISIRDVPRR